MVKKSDIALELLGIESVSHAAVAKEIWGTSGGASRAKLSHRFRGDTPISDAEAEKIIKFYRRLNVKISIALAAEAQAEAQVGTPVSHHQESE
jgi:hypothetical protein